MQWSSSRRFEGLLALTGDGTTGPPGSSTDREIAGAFSQASISDLAAWLTTAAMTGLRLGSVAVEVLCSRLRDVPPGAQGSWMQDLVAVADSPAALIHVRDVLHQAEDICYELVRHPSSGIEVLGSLPAHEVANHVALGFYRASDLGNHCPYSLFAADADSWTGASVADVLLAGRLQHSLSWRGEHLPWDFATALDVVAALVQKWGRDHVVLAAYVCTRAGTGPLTGAFDETLTSACAALASRFGEDRAIVASIALALAQDFPVTRAVQAALAVCA